MALTRDLETACLRSLKRRGATFINEADFKKFDGWTEAWTRTSLDVSGLREILDFVYEDDSHLAERSTIIEVHRKDTVTDQTTDF